MNNMKPFNLAEAKAGKPVYTKSGLKARIVCFDVKSNYPILVLVTNENNYEWCLSYNNMGQCYTNMSETNLDLIMYDETNHSFKPFDKVLVRDEDDKKWQIDLFSHIEHNNEFPYVCMELSWAQCIPFEGNEDLIGTTNTPKEK